MFLFVIGGRVIPSFTRNWLVRNKSVHLPVPYNLFDRIVIILTAVTVILWAFAPYHPITSAALIVTALLQGARLYRWKGRYAVSEPLVIILHIAYSFVPIGLLLIGLAIMEPELVPEAAGIHAVGIGAFGAMTISIMTRASQSHTGRKLKVNIATCIIYAAIIISVASRITASFVPEDTVLLHLSVLSWLIAFLGFTLCYGMMLITPRLAKK